jgi:hypothetical protein
MYIDQHTNILTLYLKYNITVLVLDCGNSNIVYSPAEGVQNNI